METDEEKKIIEQINRAIAEKRGYADFWDWPLDRDIGERGVVKNFCEALEKRGEVFLNSATVVSRGQGNDPPDCEARDLDGNLVGIEVTELVDPKAIQAVKVGQPYAWAEWDSPKLIAAVNDRLHKKDVPGRIKGGPYKSYVLLIHTDEPILNEHYVKVLLKKTCFAKRNLIDRAFLLISYDPESRSYPFLELNLEI